MQIGDKILVECTNGETALGVQYEKHCPFSVKDRHDMPFSNSLAINGTNYFDFVTKNNLNEFLPHLGEQPVTGEPFVFVSELHKNHFGNEYIDYIIKK